MTYRMPKGFALAIMFVVALIFAWPGLRHAAGEDQADSFPVSRFTMFASPLPEVQQIVYLRGIRANGEKERVPVTEVWSGGMNAGWKRLNRLARADQGKRLATCHQTAGRISKLRPLRHLKELEVVAANYSPREYFGEHKREPRSERIVVRCAIPGRAL